MVNSLRLLRLGKLTLPLWYKRDQSRDWGALLDIFCFGLDFKIKKTLRPFASKKSLEIRL